MLNKEQITYISSVFNAIDIKNYIKKNMKDYLVYKANENNQCDRTIITENLFGETIIKGGAIC